MPSVVPLFDRLAIWKIPAGTTGAEQMALDETMLRLAEIPALRVYRWTSREITFGYPQRWRDALSFAAGRPATRRCTGGGFVEHGDDVTVTLSVPASHSFSRLAPLETYRLIHETIRAALDTADLRMATETDCACGDACFSSPAPHDVLRGSRKILGGAQRRSREGFLYQGSVQGLEAPEDFSGRLARTFGEEIEEWSPPSDWESRRDESVVSRYGSESWNQRR